jgi:hypothetical protein
MNSKVTSGIANLIKTGVLTLADFPNASSAQSSSAGGIVSIQQIENLPKPAAEAIREVFRNGIRWAFISLIPWVGVAAIMSIFLSNITDPDFERKRLKKEEKKKRKEEQMAQGDEYATLGPKPKFKIYFGLGGLVVYIIQTIRWNKKKAEIDQRRAAEGMDGSTLGPMPTNPV